MELLINASFIGKLYLICHKALIMARFYLVGFVLFLTGSRGVPAGAPLGNEGSGEAGALGGENFLPKP